MDTGQGTRRSKWPRNCVFSFCVRYGCFWSCALL